MHLQDRGKLWSTSKVYQPNIYEDEKQWIEIHPLNETRSYIGVAVLRNCVVVAVGRSIEENRFRSVELFIPAIKKWHKFQAWFMPDHL